jgi:hypothetical protein
MRQARRADKTDRLSGLVAITIFADQAAAGIMNSAVASDCRVVSSSSRG